MEKSNRSRKTRLSIFDYICVITIPIAYSKPPLHMKHILTFILFLFIINIGVSQHVEFEDENFKTYLISTGIDTNNDGEIQLTEAAEVTDLQIPRAEEIVSITGIKSFINLESLIIEESLNVIEIDNMPELESLELNNDSEETEILNASNCPKLSSITQNDNGFYNYFDFSGCTSLERITSFFYGDFMDLSNCTNLVELAPEQGFGLPFPICRLDGCVNLEIIHGPVQFESVNGLNKLRKVFLETGNKNVILEDLPMLDSFAIFDHNCDSLKIKNCPNLSFFEHDINAIKTIYLDGNESLLNLNLSSFGGSALTLLNFSELKELNIIQYGIEESLKLEIKNCQNLMTAFADTDKNFGDLTIINCNSLNELYLTTLQPSTNNPAVFTFSGLFALENFLLESNVRELNINGCTNLKGIQFFTENLQLEYLDLSQCINLEYVDFFDASELKGLVLKNGTTETLGISNAPKLENICVDEDEVNDIIEMIDFTNGSVNENVVVSTNCPFSSFGKPYTLSGKSYLDINGDSCKTSDVVLSYSKYEIESEALSYTPQIFTNANGDYQFGVNEGAYFYEPAILFGDDLFITIPESNTAIFPGDSYEAVQDFCFLPQLEVDIVEVTLVALDAAQPGFESKYKVIFKNIGNIIKDGEIKVNFQDELMDLGQSTPSATSHEDGLLTWSFEDLIPYEKRELYFTMVLNTPMDDPALVGGEFLEFEAVVDPLGNQTVSSYWSDLSQEVVNSFDPNDKTCLEGMILDPEDLGDYLKYMIRFENTGTASAVNVVVKDTIDESKFDMETLEVIDASHLVEVSTENNVVSFIFRDIELPFEDEFNDGFVVFKIKTKDDLVLGDDIQNKAGIYFDFNFPIITNTASTVVSIISSLDETDNNVEYLVTPNPTYNRLLLSSKGMISKYRLTNVSDELVMSDNRVNGNKVEIDISDILSGVYFLRSWINDKEVVSKVVKL